MHTGLSEYGTGVDLLPVAAPQVRGVVAGCKWNWAQFSFELEKASENPFAPSFRNACVVTTCR